VNGSATRPKRMKVFWFFFFKKERKRFFLRKEAKTFIHKKAGGGFPPPAVWQGDAYALFAMISSATLRGTGS
jgi:hypothetical protein